MIFMANGYVIQVGHYAPQKVIVSVPNKDGNPSADVAEVYKTVGAHLLINRARVWARRVQNNGKPILDSEGEEQVLELTDSRYRGKLEFLEWGDVKTGAQAIDIRYIPQSQSLDVSFQDIIQKIQLDAEGKDGSAFIELRAGENKFDYKTQALFIEYLKVHPQNRSSVCKNPDPKIKGYTYHDVNDENTDKSGVQKIESELTAGNFVMGISNKVGSLKNLLEVLISKGVDFGDTSVLSTDLSIYTALLNFARSRAGDFGFYVNDFKKDISNLFEKAKTYNALDLTKNGFIAMLVNSKKEIVFDDANGKGDEMINWVMDNFLEQSVYERIKHLKALCDKLD